jgi:hypothetical protein
MVLVISYRNELGEMDFCHQGDEPLILIGIGNFENIQVRNAAKGMCSPGELLKIYSAKGKGKLVPVFNRAPRHEGVLGELGYSSTPLTSVLDGGEWSASRPGRFTLRERAPASHWIEGWVHVSQRYGEAKSMSI